MIYMWLANLAGKIWAWAGRRAGHPGAKYASLTSGIEVVYAFSIGGKRYYTAKNIWELPAVRLLAVVDALQAFQSPAPVPVVKAITRAVDDYLDGKLTVAQLKAATNAVKNLDTLPTDALYQLVAALYWSDTQSPYELDLEAAIADLKATPVFALVTACPLFSLLSIGDGLAFQTVSEWAERSLDALKAVSATLGDGFEGLKTELERWKTY